MFANNLRITSKHFKLSSFKHRNSSEFSVPNEIPNVSFNKQNYTNTHSHSHSKCMSVCCLDEFTTKIHRFMAEMTHMRYDIYICTSIGILHNNLFHFALKVKISCVYSPIELCVVCIEIQRFCQCIRTFS